MKKQLTVFMATAMLAGAMGTTGFAVEANPAGGNTEVYIGVTETSPTNVSVTVPTSLAIAVVDDAAKQTVETLMGNYMVDGSGNVINSGDSVQGIEEQRITFVNNGEVDAEVVSAKVINSNGSEWDIKDVPTKKYEMSMSLNTKPVGNIDKGNNNTVALDYTLEAGKTKHMPANVHAGGAVGDYDIAASAKSFIIEWNIKAK